MPRSQAKSWPHVQLFADEAEGDGRSLTLTALPMAELRRRLEAVGDRVAASLNRMPHTERPLLALQLTASKAPASHLGNLDGDDLRFLQGGLVWRPSSMRLDEPADVYVLTQSLQYPRWAPASGYEVPPVTEHHSVFYVVLLPTQVAPDRPLEIHVGSGTASFAVPTDLVAFPPHPLLWWGTPPTRKA